MRMDLLTSAPSREQSKGTVGPFWWPVNAGSGGGMQPADFFRAWPAEPNLEGNH